MQEHQYFIIAIWIHISGFMYILHSIFVLSSMQREIICEMLKIFLLTADCISNYCDFLGGGILKMICCTLLPFYSGIDK